MATGDEVKACRPDPRQRFDLGGVVVMPRFLTRSQALPLRGELEARCAPLATKAATSHHGAGVLERFGCGVTVWAPLAESSAAFVALGEMPELADVTETLLGPATPRTAAGW